MMKDQVMLAYSLRFIGLLYFLEVELCKKSKLVKTLSRSWDLTSSFTLEAQLVADKQVTVAEVAFILNLLFPSFVTSPHF